MHHTGADDGFGVSGIMALITDPNIKHGPLELLFTTVKNLFLLEPRHLITHY